MSYTAKDRDEFFILLARAFPRTGAMDLRVVGHALIGAASAHQRACEGMCSLKPPGDDYGTDDEPGYWERACLKAEARAAKILLRVEARDWSVQHQRDPRGGTLWLQASRQAEADGFRRIYPPSNGFPASVFR